MKEIQFIIRTAYRDSKKNRGKLVMFMSAIILGIAALVSINSFNDNLSADIDRQAASLLGADYVVSGNRPPSEQLFQTLDSLEGEQATEIELFSMAFIPKIDESQFVRIKALEGDFPFYGQLKTEPVKAANSFKTGQKALVDDALMLQFGLNPGDSIRLGKAEFLIEGRLQSLFGSSNLSSSFAPTVYIPKPYLEETALVQPGSLLDYIYYYKLDPDFNIDEWDAQRREMFRNESLRTDTVEERKEDLKEAFDSLNYFLNLVALVALLLGCIGVASSVFIYVKTKIPSIAVFRCLGMKGKQAFLIYFWQIGLLGLLGVIAGAILGSGIQFIIPEILSDFLPFEVSVDISWHAIREGILIGFVITVLFSLLPLISIRNISPLRTLRASVDKEKRPWDPLTYAIYGSILISLFLFLWQLTGSWKDGAMYAGGLAVAFIVLYFVSLLIIWLVRRFFPRKFNFVIRQGLSNLFRPNNQTRILLVSIGLGTAVLTTLFVIQGLLLENVAQMDAGNQPNMILYGIERDQSEELLDITKKYNLPIIQHLPIVTMSLEGWQGKTKKEWLADTTRTADRWAINRESRVTFRDSLDISEKLVKGTFVGRRDSPSDSIFISLADNYADALDVDIGDELVFNVQGAMMKTYVSSIREIEFDNMAARFFIVFPEGVLENAPQFQVLVTKSPDNVTTARYRNEVVKTFPNVSLVDLGMILIALNDILNKVSYVIKFMAVFCILTGLIVLISSLLLSKFQRIQESVLFRTLGATKKQIFQINATEYSILGALSAATGILIALAGSWALARFQLELDYHFNPLPIFFVFVFVVGLTVGIGLINSREVVHKSPLEVLRKEVG